MAIRHFPKLYCIGKDGLAEGQGPVYLIKDGRSFRTPAHPSDWSDLPDYYLGDDGKVYLETGSSSVSAAGPVYEFRGGGMLFCSADHPDGPADEPEFQLRD